MIEVREEHRDLSVLLPCALRQALLGYGNRTAQIAAVLVAGRFGIINGLLFKKSPNPTMYSGLAASELVRLQYQKVNHPSRRVNCTPGHAVSDHIWALEQLPKSEFSE